MERLRRLSPKLKMIKQISCPSLVCLCLFALTVQGQDRVIHADDRKAEEVPFAADAEKEDEKELSKEIPFKSMNMWVARIPFLFAAERWRNFVNSTLNEEQTKKWNQFTDRRHEAATDAQAFALAACLSGLNLTGQQQLDAHKLFKRAVKSQGAKLEDAFALVRDYSILSAVTTEQEILAAIGEDNWEKLADSTKQQIVKKKEEGESDAAEESQ